MRSMSRRWFASVSIGLVLAAWAGPLAAQAQGKKTFSVSVDAALDATRATLVQEGYDVVKLEPKDEVLIVHYRRGNMGKGRGKGPMQTMVLRRVRETVVFEEADPALLVKIQLILDL